MTRLDERLRRELEKAARPADPTGVYEELIRRRERRRIARRVEAGLVAFAVSVGSLAAIWTLTRAGDGIVANPGPGDEIAAVLSDGGHYRLALISAEDGSVRSPLPPGALSSPTYFGGPLAWSPDGGTLALWYVGDLDGSNLEPPGIYTIPADGGTPSLLYGTERATGDFLHVEDIAWSPAGDRIAFAVDGVFRALDGGGIKGWTIDPTVYTVAVDGSDLQRLPIEGSVYELAWSPDGSALAVTKSGPRGQDIYLVDLETGAETRLTDDGRSFGPAWSPDGRQIAFTSGDAQVRGLFVMNADGTGRRRLTYPDGSDASPTWSPDGAWIAVSRSMWAPSGASGALGPSGLPAGPLGASGPLGYGTACQVVLVAADGSAERVLVDGPIDGACAVDLAWRPTPITGATEEPATDTTPTPEPTASPSPTASPTASPAAELDLATGCGLSALQADYDGDGALDVAVVATLPRDGGCPEPGKGETYLGIGFGQTEQDVGAGTFRTDLTFGPIDCGPGVGCRVFAAPDLDGDGAAELALVQDAGASVAILGLYRVDFCGPAENCLTAAWISPIEVAEPGDPELGLEPGPATIRWGGGGSTAAGASCETVARADSPETERRLVVWVWSDDGGATHAATFRLEGAELVLVQTRDYFDPTPEGDVEFCGSPVLGWATD